MDERELLTGKQMKRPGRQHQTDLSATRDSFRGAREGSGPRSVHTSETRAASFWPHLPPCGYRTIRLKPATPPGGTTISDRDNNDARTLDGPQMHSTTSTERALLVALESNETDARDPLDARLDELAELATTAGAHVIGKVGQKRKMPDPAFLIGHGKADELFAEVQETAHARYLRRRPVADAAAQPGRNPEGARD
jgi:hypothetical protein